MIKKIGQIIMSLFVVLCIVLVALLVYARYLEGRSIFHPAKDILVTPLQEGLPFEDVFIKTEDHVRLNAWFIPNAQAKATILFFHGNGGNNSDRLDTIQFYHDIGLNVFIVDYRGYGQSEGKPTEKGIYLDALAAYDYLVKERHIAPQMIISYGASLGGAPAIDLATKRPLGALIIDSSFSSAADMAKNMYPIIPSFLLKVKFDSARKASNISIPKLFIHSINDEMIPFGIGKKLFDASAEPKQLLTVTSLHNATRGPEDARKVAEAVRAFLIKNGLL